MTRITYISDTHLIHLKVEHVKDLTFIKHNSIHSPENGMVGMNDKHYELWLNSNKSLSSLKAIISTCDEVSMSYYRLMASGDVGEILTK